MKEDTALEILRLVLGRRGLETKTERMTTEDVERANIYTIGNVLVIFSQKERGLLERDINTFITFAENNQYQNGVIIVSLLKPSENVLRAVKKRAKDRIQMFHIRELQFDITTHRMAMPHRILKEDERTQLFNDRKVSSPEQQLPAIDSQDIMARLLGAVPGDIIGIQRHSDVAGMNEYYRYCVEDANVV
jgi:DNA-directed RNA polymerase subunit H (RpoH/RPB5)